MMLACRAFHDLVAPRFLSELDLRGMFYPESALMNFVLAHRRDPSRIGFEAVRTLDLDLGRWETDMFGRFQTLIEACTKLQNASFSFSSWEDARAALHHIRAENLTELRLRMEGEPDGAGWYERTRSLKVFSYAGAPSRAFFRGVVEQCPSLESVDCELWLPWALDHETLNHLLPAKFVRKIRTWTCLHPAALSVALSLNGFDPTSIMPGEDIEDISFPSEACWRSITGLSRLRTLWLETFDPELLLLGLPPNLEELRTGTVDVSGLPPAVLGAIAAKLAGTNLRLFVDLYCPRSGESAAERLTVGEMKAMKREVLFWESLENAGIEYWSNDGRSAIMAVSDADDSDGDELD
ncbi:hypothetical protein DFJ74DRAFT_688165, partial [Hyaloraphidium curvatum]